MFEICMVFVPLPGILMVFYYVVPVIMSPMLSSCYVSDCPTTSEIKQRSLQHPCPENKAYHILWDPEIKKYAERCLISQPIPQGNAIILDQSGSIHTEPCWEGTFQPTYYTSDTQCACSETKGQCNKTGQIVASNGNTTHDRTCRCDFKRGYKISTTPSNECVCKSSSKDCTCIKEECKTGYRMSPDYVCALEKWFSTTYYTCKDYITSEESTTESVPDSGTSKRMPTCTVQCYVTAIIAICTALGVIIVFCVLGAFIFGKKKMIKIISCICAPMRICCKKCRPGRNRSAPTTNEGTEHVPVQVTDSVATEILSHIKGDESEDEVTNEQPPIEDNYLEGDVFIDLSKSAKLKDEVTYKQPLTDHSYLENDAVNEMSALLEVVEKPAPDEVTSKQPETTHSYLMQRHEKDTKTTRMFIEH